MTVGEKVTEQPYFGSAYGMMEHMSGLLTGTVVYIHPLGRFYTVEFTSGRGISWRESFFPQSVRGNPNAPKMIGGGVNHEPHRIKKTRKTSGLYG